MYEVFGLTEEEGKAIDQALCRIVAPLVGMNPKDLTDEAILGWLDKKEKEAEGENEEFLSPEVDIGDVLEDLVQEGGPVKYAAKENCGGGFVRFTDSTSLATRV